MRDHGASSHCPASESGSPLPADRMVQVHAGELEVSMRKLTDADVQAIRAGAEAGRPRRALADEFCISVQHVGRIVRGETRQRLDDVDQALGPTGAALELLLGELADELDAEQQVRAEAARALAKKLDALTLSTTATAATAAPAVARALDALVAQLAAARPAEDAVSRLQRRTRLKLRRLDDEDGSPL